MTEQVTADDDLTKKNGGRRRPSPLYQIVKDIEQGEREPQAITDALNERADDLVDDVQEQAEELSCECGVSKDAAERRANLVALYEALYWTGKVLRDDRKAVMDEYVGDGDWTGVDFVIPITRIVWMLVLTKFQDTEKIQSEEGLRVKQARDYLNKGQWENLDEVVQVRLRRVADV